MPCARPKPDIDRHRLARCLLLSLLLHGALLTGNDPPPADQVSRQRLPITLTWTAPTPPRATADKLQSLTPINSGAVQRNITNVAPSVASTQEHAPPPASESIHDRLENARQTAHDEAVRIERQGKPDGPRQDSPENRLARALARPQAQEKLLANGTYKITTSAGTTYCLNEPPDYNRGGLSEALRIASTCP